jgi:hypothetical protein
LIGDCFARRSSGGRRGRLEVDDHEVLGPVLAEVVSP